MKVSNCLLSVIGAIISLTGIFSNKENVSYFGWGMLVVTLINTFGLIVDYKKTKTEKTVSKEKEGF